MTRVGLGVVEGFYGTPWSFAARRRVIASLPAAGLETYAYAPKSDPAHRARWWRPLDADQLREMETLAEDAREAGVRFVYGIAPERLFGGKMNLSARASSEGFEALFARCAALASRGVRDFMVLFDDTWPTVVPWLASYAGGRAHGAIAERLVDRLHDVCEGAAVSIVPAVYSGRAAELSRGAAQYLRGVGATARVPIAWTGPRIFSSWISRRDTDAIARAAGAPVWIWNNAIANDWLPMSTGEPVGLRATQRLSFGPADNLAPDVYGACAGILLNGAREVELTRAALVAFGEQARDPGRFDAHAAAAKGIATVFGDASVDVAKLRDLVRGHPLAASHVAAAPKFYDLARRAKSSGAARDELAAYLRELSTLDEAIDVALVDHPGRDELLPTARKIAAGARALARACDPSGRVEARALARTASSIPWATGIDAALRLAEKGLFL